MRSNLFARTAHDTFAKMLAECAIVIGAGAAKAADLGRGTGDVRHGGDLPVPHALLAG